MHDDQKGCDVVPGGRHGPDRSIKMEDLRTGKAITRRYRNRRIGEFLKELDLTEGRSTGIPKVLRVMAENGSPHRSSIPMRIARTS